MRPSEDVLRVLLLCVLLHSGRKRGTEAVFVYGRLGGGALLPCTGLVSSNCSLVSWTFYRGGDRNTCEVRGGQVVSESDKSSRLSLRSNCSLHLRDLRVADAGSYVCLGQDGLNADVYLSLLTITSPSRLTDLQPGGRLSLSCILFTYYDAGSCKSYSSVFSVSWLAADGTELPRDRYEITERTRCNVTLATTLQSEDNNRRWRCQVNTSGSSSVVFQDFTPVFLFHSPSAQVLAPSAALHCPVQLPVSRILLCVALPLMVIIVGLVTWRTNQKLLAETSAAGTELQEIHC